MNQKLAVKLANKICELRSIQLDINRSIISGEFLIPIHLAIGHEAIAVSVGEVLESEDKLLLTHRNIHYQLALNATKDQLNSEYILSQKGLAEGKLGSMNLMNPKKGNIYTSNILGNNLAVSLGIALASKMNSNQGVIWAVTGDGAIEGGTFYESILIASSLNLPIIFLIENNFWSLGTSITERRISINLELLEPIKHEEIIINIIETREFNGYEITKIHNNNNIGEMTNRRLLGRKIKKGDLIGFKECICISSYQIGQLLMFEKI
jgi:TPP-dependent pyruvate/acetoin dehydrogenase alpha subunit